MRTLKLFALLSLGLLVGPYATQAHAAQIGIGVGVGPAFVGPEPVCPYGYYDYYPYTCAPYGYYGPEWFSGGVFIGVGPWGHGFHRGFYAGHGPVRGDYGRMPAFGGHPAFRGDGGVRGGFNHGGGFHAGGAFNRGGGFHGGGSRGGGRR